MKERRRRKPEKIVSNLSNFLLAYYFKQLSISELQEALNKPVIKKEINNPLQLPDFEKDLITMTSLEWSIMHKDLKLTHTLLNAGANPDFGCLEYPIFIAIDNLQKAKTDNEVLLARLTLDLLKKKNVKLDAKTKGFKRKDNGGSYGITHYILCCEKPYEILKTILGIFPKIDLEVIEYGTTPLMRALYLKNLPLAKLLCDNGVSLKSSLHEGVKLTPLTPAVHVGDVDSIAFILNKMIEKKCDGMRDILEDLLLDYLPKMDIEVARVLLKTHLVNLNQPFMAIPQPGSSESQNTTLMHKVCRRGDIAMFQLFLEYGGIVNIHQIVPKTPGLLLVAIMNNQMDLVEWLLDSNALDDIAIFSGWHASKILKDGKAFQEAIEMRCYKRLTSQAQVDVLRTGLFDMDEVVLPRLYYLIARDDPKQIEEMFEINTPSIAYTSFYRAIKNDSIKCVKYFMDFCNIFSIYQENCAVWLAIHERNHRIMEIFVQDCRQKGTIQALEACLYTHEAHIKTLPDAEECLLFIQTIRRFYFQERTAISFDIFDSASAHQYLKEQGFQENPPVINSVSVTKESLFKPKSVCNEPTWFGGQRLDMQLLKPVEGNSHKAYIWLLEEEAYAVSGCTPQEFLKFHATRASFAAGSTNIEKITLPYALPCNINGHAQTLQCSHELRIKKSVARILLFPVLSDCKRCVIYVGGKYLEDGLHKTSDSTNLMNSNRHGTRVVSISIPVISNEKSLSDSCP